MSADVGRQDGEELAKPRKEHEAVAKLTAQEWREIVTSVSSAQFAKFAFAGSSRLPAGVLILHASAALSMGDVRHMHAAQCSAVAGNGN